MQPAVASGVARDDSPAAHPAPDLDLGPAGLALDILDDRRLLSTQALGWLTEHARRGCAMLLEGHPVASGHEVRVRLVTDDQMAAAHARHMGLNSTTDVLTFDLRDGDDATRANRPLDTDILACVDEARRQADRRAVPVERELLLYVLHGVLHCLGEDDHDPRAFERMHAREDRVLRALGVGETFALPERTQPESAFGPAGPHGRGEGAC